MVNKMDDSTVTQLEGLMTEDYIHDVRTERARGARLGFSQETIDQQIDWKLQQFLQQLDEIRAEAGTK
jgi:hypothetical protein